MSLLPLKSSKISVTTIRICLMRFVRTASDKQKLQIFPQSVGHHIIWTTSNYCISINITMYCMYKYKSIIMNKVIRGIAYCMQWDGLAGQEAYN